jgi:hypothetical protein
MARNDAADLTHALAASRDLRQRAELAGRLAVARERIKRCEERLMVVSMGQKAPCDVAGHCGPRL